MGKTPCVLLRRGNATSAKLDTVRATDVVLYDVSGVQWVAGRSGGVSTFSVITPALSGKLWRLRSGSDYDDAILSLCNDAPDHWSWEAAFDMPLSNYRAALAFVNRQFIPV